ncbi:hypothetical protein FBR05_08940 [Deltaproteobacteria bacterium PRO3]|nr:hypothetical protein [Deltaproteobacteria bacterium PRO3]
MVLCHHCGKTSESGDRIGRNETCPHCGDDLHVCYNCQHYDPKAYNECQETQAERVLEKDKANFCDYFAPSDRAMRAGEDKKKDDAKAKLDALFKKP